jgi:glycosyltransferase involved in cell wall biosynthesis
MRVSVITPTLNPGDRLVRCLESVAAQTYPDLEHVVVDGGSDDDTIRLLQDSGVRFVTETDGGQTEALNKGFSLANGTLLTWLNADDVLQPGAAEAAVEAVQADPAVGLVYGDCVVRESRGPCFRVRPPRRIGRETFNAGNVLCQPGSFFTRTALERVGRLDESFALAMDYDLWIRMIDAGVRSAYVPRTLAIFEIHPDSKTGAANPGEFFREEAQALAKSGRARQAAFGFGRAAAALGVSIEDVAPELKLDAAAARAGLDAERGVRELRRRSPRGVVLLARSLGSLESRRRLAFLARVAWCRVRHRVGRMEA